MITNVPETPRALHLRVPDLKMPLSLPPLASYRWASDHKAATAFHADFDPLVHDNYQLKAWFAEWLSDPDVCSLDLNGRIALLSDEMGRRAALSYSLRTGMTTMPTAWSTEFRRLMYKIAGAEEPRPKPNGRYGTLIGIQWVRYLVSERKASKERDAAKARRASKRTSRRGGR